MMAVRTRSIARCSLAQDGSILFSTISIPMTSMPILSETFTQRRARGQYCMQCLPIRYDVVAARGSYKSTRPDVSIDMPHALQDGYVLMRTTSAETCTMRPNSVAEPVWHSGHGASHLRPHPR